jgi:hypothetical protein
MLDYIREWRPEESTGNNRRAACSLDHDAEETGG